MWAHYADSHKGFCIEYSANSKSIDWEYEKDWRAFEKVAGTSVRLVQGDILGVYFDSN